MAISFWAPEQRTNTKIGGNQHQSSQAALQDGGFVATWTENDREFGVTRDDVFAELRRIEAS